METPLEKILDNSFKDEMMSYMASHPDDFDELLSLATADKQPYSWRAAWLLSNLISYNDERVKKHLPQLIDRLTQASDSHKRDITNVLLKMEIDEEYDGLLFDSCIRTWSSLDKIPSVRWTALQLALKISAAHSELLAEIELVTQEQYLQTLSPGIKKSIKRTLQKLE